MCGSMPAVRVQVCDLFRVRSLLPIYVCFYPASFLADGISEEAAFQSGGTPTPMAVGWELDVTSMSSRSEAPPSLFFLFTRNSDRTNG